MMSKFHAWIEKRNFKRIFLWYLILAIVTGIACAVGVGFVFQDKIRLAMRYEQASEAFQKNQDEATLEKSLHQLAASSGDIVDVLLLDENNRVMYSEKQTKLAWDTSFDLRQTDNKFLVSDQNPDVAFRFVKKDEFMLSSVFANDFESVHEEYDEDHFYQARFQNQKLYMISLLGKRNGPVKAYVISDPTPVPYGILALKIAASVCMLLFMIYWILVALWVYQNAAKSKLSAPIWGIITLFTNLAGVLWYLIYKHASGVCAYCGAVQSRGNLYCTFCGKKIGSTCRECGHGLKPTDYYCPKCGLKREDSNQ